MNKYGRFTIFASLIIFALLALVINNAYGEGDNKIIKVGEWFEIEQIRETYDDWGKSDINIDIWTFENDALTIDNDRSSRYECGDLDGITMGVCERLDVLIQLQIIEIEQNDVMIEQNDKMIELLESQSISQEPIYNDDAYDWMD